MTSVPSAASPSAPRLRGGPAAAQAGASAVGERLASEIRRGVAAFQRDGDGWGVTAVVDRARPAAFSCDQDLVLRQSMADRGWSVPQFVARRPPDRRARGVELPRHSAVEALGGAGRRAAEPAGVARQRRRRRAAAAAAGRRPYRGGGPHRARGGSCGGCRAGRGRVGVGGGLRCRAGAFGASSRVRRRRRGTASSGRPACCARWWRRWRGRGW